MGEESEELYVLKREDLIAPMQYNLVNEMEKFSAAGQKPLFYGRMSRVSKNLGHMKS